MARDFYNKIEQIVKKDSRYKPDAYEFVMKSLFYTQKRLKRQTHITGRELTKGIKQYCFQEFGPMSKTVLEHWGIKKTSDFGHIVFNMVNSGLMKKTEEDSIEDFVDVYDFQEVFVNEYQEQLGRQLKKEQSKA
ncbi:MAG: hypothetical protein ISS47_09095 [Candidatus Omnitrophica bacterium]|nr:hypothetical protein [Candidatus Omnitrophota bacterium]